MQPILQRNRVFLIHLLFWCIYLSFNLYQVSFYQQRNGYDWSRGLLFTGVQFAFTFAIAYLNYFIFLPRFLVHKKTFQYTIEFLVPFSILVLLRIYLQRYMMAESPRIEYFYSAIFIVQVAVITLFITIFVSMLRFAVDWFELEARKREIENEKLYAELNFLRAQINPHFLFNTLNNLYYLAYSKSDNTTEVISKLSNMMRYMIYESNHEKVLLNKEIEYMQNYISLEQLRLNNQVPIEFKIEGNTEDIWIAPLILITFLENAFKHGVNGKSSETWIKIGIRMDGKQCHFSVENSKQSPTLDSREGKSGIGLQNVNRRLELSYPEQYQLNVEEKPDRYSVELEISLT